MIGVIGAMKVEIDGIIGLLSNLRKKRRGGFVFHCGMLHNKSVVVCCCGIGKVNSAIAATLMIELYKSLNLIINLGVAGGIKPGIQQGDIVIGKANVQHDYDLSPDGLKKAQIAGFDFVEIPSDLNAVVRMENVLNKLDYVNYTGVIASGDQFIADKNKAKSLFNEFNAYACDMESASIAHVCHLFSISFLSMRAISDNGDDGAVEAFNTFVEKAAKKSCSAVSEFIKF